MKTFFITGILILSIINIKSQTLQIDSIPNPECISGNLYEPALEISSTGRIYYGGADHTYYSTDYGVTWDTSVYSWTNYTPIQAMAVSPVSGNVYIGAKNYGGFGMSVDSGISFTMPTTTYCYSIYADEYGNVFAGLGGVLRKFKDGNYNLGSTVLAVSGGSVYNICKGEQGELYAVMKQKIFMSTDTGNTWVLKSEITSGSSEFRHVIASANNKILYGKTRVNLQETDTSFTTSTTVNCYTGMNSIKTANGFMFFPERSNYWSLSYDNGITFSKYYGSGFNSLINGATVPSMSYEAKNVNGLATYNNKIYYAGANCVIIVLSKGTGSTDLVEKEKENQISIYPNPITKNQILTIEGVQSDDKIIVRNVVGKEVFNSIGRNKISLQENKSGIYFLTIMSDNKTKTLKFIVK